MTSPDAYAGVRVLVLGGSGFIARWVARALTERGADVSVVVRDMTAAEQVLRQVKARAQLFVCDLERGEDLGPLTKDLKPAVTFNLAGYGVDLAEQDKGSAERLNTDLPAHLPHLVASFPNGEWPGQRIVHVGTALEYGDAGGHLLEDSALHPITLYGRTKLAGTVAFQQACQSRSIPGLVARLFTVYGPGEHSHRLLPTLLAATGSSEPIPLTDGFQQRDFTYVVDVAEGLLRLGLTQARPGTIVNLATGRLTAVRAFITTAATVIGLDKRRLHFGALPTRPEEMVHDTVTIERLRKLTGWRPETDIEPGIAQTAQWYASSVPQSVRGEMEPLT
jgi:nucleoside-diphosphate-sugar epimerase